MKSNTDAILLVMVARVLRVGRRVDARCCSSRTSSVGSCSSVKPSRRWRSSSAIIVPLAAFFAGAAHGQSPEAQKVFDSKVADRLSQIAGLVENESAQGAKLSTLGATLGPQKFGAELEKASKVSRFPQTVSKQMSSDLVNSASTPAARARTKKALLVDIKSRTSGLSGYGRSLRTASEALKGDASHTAFASLEAGAVPHDAAIVIAGAGPSLSTPAVPQPFAVNLPPTSPPIYEFIIGLGVATVDYPSTAAILYRMDPGGPLIIACTGTLIAPNAVLTAGHCVTSDQLHAPAAVFFQHAGLHEVVSTVVHPAFSFPSADLAIVFLKESVSGIQPLALNDAAKVAPGSHGRIVGYGYHSGLAASPGTVGPLIQQAGMKYAGTVTTDACDEASAGKGLVCWTYQAGSLESLASSTCHGDSGGPLIIWIDGGWALAGVTSGGETCLPGDKPFDTEVFDYAAWINQTLNQGPPGDTAGTNLATSLVPVIDNRLRFAMPAAARIFSPQDASWARPFTVAAGTKTLRVAMNTSGFGGTMHFAVGHTGDANSCDTRTDDMAASCEISDPKSGEWQVSLSGIPSQEYQVVATTF